MDELAALVEQLPDEILDYIEDLENRVEKAEADLESLGDPTPEPISDIEKALSELPPEVASVIKSQTDRLAEAEKALEAERLAKANAEWIAKARAFDGLVDSPDEFGSKLRAVADVDAELANTIMSTLQAADSRLAKGALFSELGHGASDSGTVVAKVETVAKALREADPQLTEEAAMSKALESNPALYDQYVAERRESGVY